MRILFKRYVETRQKLNDLNIVCTQTCEIIVFDELLFI